MGFRIEDDHPHYLIARESEHEHDITRFERLVTHWMARFERGQRFGVIFVSESVGHHEHDHDDDAPHERDADYEAAFSKLLNDFRRDHKAKSEQWTVGFARVLPAAWLDAAEAAKPGSVAAHQAETDRMARYIWGVPGNLFGTVEAAQAWMSGLFDQTPIPSDPAPSAIAPSRVGLFYGSTTGTTEYIADQIAEAWGAAGLSPIVAQNIGHLAAPSDLLAYDVLLLGIPTWNIGQLQDDWDVLVPRLATLDFTGKQVALFGIGDQYGYPDNFLDAVGILGELLESRGAVLIGGCPTDGYEFSHSRAVRDGRFIGLAIDEEHQSRQTPERIAAWVSAVAQYAQPQPTP